MPFPLLGFFLQSVILSDSAELNVRFQDGPAPPAPEEEAMFAKAEATDR